MTKINELTAVDTVADGDQFAIWSTVNGDTRRVALSAVKAFVQLGARVLDTQYAAPSATGFSVTVTGTDDAWLILTPVAGYADGTIVLPASPTDKQRVEVSCSQAVTTLTVGGNGNSVVGAPTTLAAGGFFAMLFDDVLNSWYRVG